MFEFLFKRPADKPDDTQVAAPARTDVASEQAAARRSAQAEQCTQLGGDETAAAAFILQCDYSELRLLAAEVIVSQPLLEQVHQAMRNTDRRVAKLMQGRLDALRHQQLEQQRAQACIAQAQQLQQDEKLTPNHVADLDRSWSVIAAPAELAGQFAALRTALSARLNAQVALQRAAMDRVGALRQLPGAIIEAQALSVQLEQFAAAHAQTLQDAEVGSLPKHLLSDFAQELARVQAALPTLAQQQNALAARQHALTAWQALAPAELPAETLQRHWNQLPGVTDAELAGPLQQQFDALLASLPVRRSDKPARASAPAKPADPQFDATLDAMEASLQQGALQHACELDKQLKDSKGTRLTPAQFERLNAVRAELKRLSDWARWGGNVSREELVKAVEGLGEQGLGMSELAKKVGSLRERWKSLDTLSGNAPKSLWERFDSACTRAYAPAAAHFKQLADERHAHADTARALIAEARAASAALGEPGDIDWKHLATLAQRLRQGWTRLGAIDRKEKKRLDGEFDQAVQALQAPLQHQRADEMARREQLIAELGALNPNDRHTLDAVRALQERWQVQARALPLERKAEQALWQRFRAGCDAIFAARKESAHAADAERHAHEKAKLALCERLEAGATADAGDAKARAHAAGVLLREVANAWQSIGPVPRAHEARIDLRHQAGVTALQALIDGAKRQAGAAQASALRDKLHLCQQLEAALGAEAPDESDWAAKWTALAPLAPDFERALRARFDAAVAAHAGQRAAYLALLEANRASLLRDILRLEIVAGIDSGADFARDRLKLQVEVLQSSLKSGQKQGAGGSALLQLCALPAHTDARSATRIDALLRRALAGDGK